MHCVSVKAMRRGVLLIAALAGCAGGGEATRVVEGPRAPRTLTVLLQRGALASVRLTLDSGSTGPDDGLPDALRPGAAHRYLERALPVDQKGERAVARLGKSGRLVGVAIGDFSGPLVVVEDRGPEPEVLLEGGNVRLLFAMPRRLLREVTTESALVAVSPHADVGGAAIRLGPGLPIERLAGADTADGKSWVRYRDSEVEVVGLVDPSHLGTVYRAAIPGPLTAGDADVPTPLVLLDQPSGRPFATIWRPAGRLIPAARLKSDRHYTLVRIDLSHDLTLTGWIRSPRAEATVTDVRERARPARRGQWFSVPGLPGRDLHCVELPRGARLFDGPAGAVRGLVTRGDRFILLGAQTGWIEVGVGHPFGFAHLWLPDRHLVRVPCDTSTPSPGTT
jgi:hypothetical protein